MKKSINILLCLLVIVVANGIYAMQQPVPQVDHQAMLQAYTPLMTQLDQLRTARLHGNLTPAQMQQVQAVRDIAENHRAQALHEVKWVRMFAVIRDSAQKIIDQDGRQEQIAPGVRRQLFQ